MQELTEPSISGCASGCTLGEFVYAVTAAKDITLTLLFIGRKQR